MKNLLHDELVWLPVSEADAGTDVSLDERYQVLNEALCAQFGYAMEGYQRFYVQELFVDYFIARETGTDTLYRIGYTINADGSYTLSEAQEVEEAYIPVSESATFLDVAEAAGEAASDTVYPVKVLTAGWGRGSVSGTKLKHYYPVEFVSQVAEAVNGAKFGRRHPEDDSFGEDDPDRIAGWFEGGRLNGNVAEADLNVLESETAMRSKFSAARKAGKLGSLFGLSILGNVGWRKGKIDGIECLVAEKLAKLASVDLCGEPGAGGGFLENRRVAASAASMREVAALQNGAVRHGSSVKPGGQSIANRGDSMDKKLLILRVIESLRSQDATAAVTFTNELNVAKEADHDALLAKVSEALMTSAKAAGDAAVTKAEQTLREANRLQFINVMEAALTDSKLPEPGKKLVRRRFEGDAAATAKKEDLDAEIIAVREAMASTAAAGRVSGVVVPGLDSEDKIQIACDLMLGVKEAAGKGVPAFKGLRSAYTQITGDFEMLGFGAVIQGRVRESVATSDFPNILLNSMTKRLLQGWADYGMAGLDQLFEVASPTNYLLQDRVRDGYFDELPVVAEGQPYTEIAKPTDERVSYAVQNYGNLLTISEQTIRNDNLGAISKWPDKLVRAGMKTLKNYVTGFFANNSAYQADAVNWFDSSHGNLGSGVFGYDALVAAEIALFIQTEKNSGEQLGLTLDWIMVPIQLKAAAIAINQTNTAGANGFYQRFGANNERIIVNEKLTDTNDWYYGTSKDNAPFLEIGFLDGIQQPQIFLANNPLVGTAFTNDQIQYKVKHPFGGAITDYRGVGKQVVAG